MRQVIMALLYILLWGLTALALAFLFFLALGGIGANPSAGSSKALGLVILAAIILSVLSLISIPAIPVTFAIGPKTHRWKAALALGVGIFIGMPIIHGGYKELQYRQIAKFDRVDRDFKWPDKAAYYKQRTGCDDLCAELLFDGHVKSLTVYQRSYKSKRRETADSILKFESATTFHVESRKTCEDPRTEGFYDLSSAILKNSTIGRCLIAKPGGDQTEDLHIRWDWSVPSPRQKEKFTSVRRLQITKGPGGLLQAPSSDSILAQRTDARYRTLKFPLFPPFVDQVNAGGGFSRSTYYSIRDPLGLMRVISPLGDAGDEKLDPRTQKRKFKDLQGGAPKKQDIVDHAIRTFSEMSAADMPPDILEYELALQAEDYLKDLPKKSRRQYRKSLGLALLNAAEFELEYRLKHPDYKLTSQVRGRRANGAAILSRYVSLVYRTGRKKGYEGEFIDPPERVRLFEDKLFSYVIETKGKYGPEDKRLRSYDNQALKSLILIMAGGNEFDKAAVSQLWDVVLQAPPSRSYGFTTLLRRYPAPISPIIVDGILSELDALPEGEDPRRWFELLSNLSATTYETHLDPIARVLEKYTGEIHGLYLEKILPRMSAGGERSWPVLTQYLRSQKLSDRQIAAHGLCLSKGPLSEGDYIDLRDELFSGNQVRGRARSYARLFVSSGYIDRFVGELEAYIPEPEQTSRYEKLKKDVRRYTSHNLSDC